MEVVESILDTLHDDDGASFENLADDLEMLDIEEGECVDKKTFHTGLAQSVEGNVEQKEKPLSRNKRKNKKKKNKKKKKKDFSGSAVVDVDSFVLAVCKRLRERKSYLVYTAVGCLGIPALNDLVNEVEAIQACGGQKTVDGRRERTGGGILWNILKVRDPNAFKEIMKRGKEFEKQFRRPNTRQTPFSNRVSAINSATTVSDQATASETKSDASEIIPASEDLPTHSTVEGNRVSVHNRIRVPVSYDDLLEVKEAKYELD